VQISKLLFPMLASALLLGSASACKTAPPKELIDAREQYRRTLAGPARLQAPADVDNARIALDRAEHAFRDDPDAPETRDYAYIAERKAQLATVKGATENARQQKLTAEKQLAETNKAKLAESKEALQTSRQETLASKAELATSEQQNLNSQERLADSKEQLAEEKQQNLELIASLADMGTVKEDDRGTVISLSGGVLFASGKSTLLPSALTALDSVANALNKQDRQDIRIEGHTDSVGSDNANQLLSNRRADAVRTYLIGRGVSSGRIEAIGFGSSRAIADNLTADGRANNRRVEIVILHGRT
jgi:outer membrane protein OmpA-like peptidoglycan-associated protein